MGLRDKSIRFIRRLSVFYLLLIVLIVCFGLYYFNYVPHNKDGLNESGQRTLIQLSANFTQKSADVKDIFDGTDSVQDLIDKKGSYQYLNANIPYTLDRLYADSAGKPIPLKSPTPFIYKDRSGQWCIQYATDSLKGDSVILIRMKDFIGSLLEGRDDIFDTYMLFKDHDPSGSGHSFNLDILYRDDNLSTSATLNADSLLKTQKNSDLSGIVDLSISGIVYKLFLRPFDFYGQRIYLAGLISKDNYEKRVQSTPLNFIPYSIVLFLLIFINMPFLKIYLLSPMERINRRDVLSAALSFFLGSSILVLIVFYLFINVFTKMTFNNRLNKFGDGLHANIETEFRLADKQLWQYDSIYNHLDTGQKQVLVYRQKDTAIRNQVYAKLIPTTYYNISRLFWIDSAGHTIAKWNPFNFNAPLSSVRNFDVYKIFQKQASTDNSFIDSEQNIIYSGKSNTTGEFQVYIVKPLRRPIIVDTGGHSVNSVSISLAIFLNSGTRPVIPFGFGYCLIDHAGRILMDADEHRNLTENLLEETDNNARLMHCIRYRNEAIINNVSLYRQPRQMKIMPIHGQPLYLVVYYDKGLLTNNTLRLLQFTIETLACVYIALALCILLSGMDSFCAPTRLRFRLNKIEWVRYSTANKNAYAFIKVYYKYLAILTMALFLVILTGRMDMRGLFYTSVVLPFYTVWAFIFSGIRSIPSGRQKLKKYVQSLLSTDATILLSGLSIFFCLIIVNIICLSFFRNDLSFVPGSKFLFLLFQVLAALGLLLTRRWSRKKETKWKIKERKIGKKVTEQDFSRPNYIVSLCLAILLIGVLPTLGVLTYGFNSEKIQYKKTKLLKIARSSEERCLYLTSKIIPSYRPMVRTRFNQTYFDSLLFRSGIYLTERDSVAYRSEGQMDSLAVQGAGNGEISDQPYSNLMDNYYFHTGQDHDTWSITGKADDSSWLFFTSRDSLDWINLYYKNRIARRMGYQFLTRSSLQNPLIDFLHLPLWAILLFLLLTLSFIAWFNWLIKGTTDRLFLFTFTREGIPDRDINLLMKFLADPSLMDQCLPTPRLSPARSSSGQSPASPSSSGQSTSGQSSPVLPVSYDRFLELTAPEFSTDRSVRERETLILDNEQRFESLYDCIWNDLAVEEQYILYDFCVDGYTNYKNRDQLNSLMDKGILILKEDAFKPFSLSFRDHVLSKRSSPALNQFMAGRTGGFWSSLRIPILTIVAVVGIFTAFTESDFTNKLGASLTSLLALFPLVLKFLENFRAGRTADKSGETADKK